MKNKFCTKQEMIKLLKERNLEVDNTKILDEINYSHLIYHFGKHYLIDKKNKFKYIKGTKLSNIYNLYLLNLEISQIIFKVIHLFEHKMKNTIAHKLASVGEIIYLDETFYWFTDEKTRQEVKNFVKEISELEIAKRNLYSGEKYFKGLLPIWLLVDEMSFSQLRRMIKLSPLEIRKIILKDLNINYKKWWIIGNIHNYRNKIFHASPLEKIICFNQISKKEKTIYKLKDLIKFMIAKYRTEYQKLVILIKNYEYKKINMNKEQFLKILDLNELLMN